MSQEKRKVRRMRKKRWKLLFFSAVFIFFLFRNVSSLFATTFKTILPEQYIIEDKIETEAIIIKKETVYKADGEGKIELHGNDGERVAVGSKIAKITLLDDASTLKQELEEIDKKINILKKTELDNQNIKNDEKRIEESIENIINDIQMNIFHRKYEEAEILKDKLSIYDGKQKDIGRDNTLISQSLDNLNEKRKEIANQISSNVMNYYARESGILSFTIDGYEEIYSINHIDDYQYSDFNDISNKQKITSNNDNVKTGEPIYKIMDNFEWYMIIKVENMKDVSSYDEGDLIVLTGENIEGELKGYIDRISRNRNRGLIVVKFNTDFYHYQDKRHLDVNIIRYRHDGYKIPSKAIVQKDGVEGVYIKEINGIVRFRPIEIIKVDDKFTYISKGDKNYNINIKGSDKLVRTVKQFDEIFLNTNSIKEGMIID